MPTLRHATLADGRVVDVELSQADGTITAVRSPASPPELSRVGDDVDLRGYILIPAPAEPHAHLDKALTADLVPNPRGDLEGAIDAWVQFVPHITTEAMVERGVAAAWELVASGVTAVRTHTNVHPGIELKAIEALLEVRRLMADVLDIQIVALVGVSANRTASLLRAALEMDPAIISGGCPHLEADPRSATDLSLGLAAELGRPIDLHTDEQLDPRVLSLPYFASRVAEIEFPHGATASHCVSLGMQTPDVQAKVAEAVAAAGVAVVTLPQTNLFLQGRGIGTSPPRGLTALRPLLDAGATLAAGADNVRDPFNLMGRSDPLETAALLVMAGHLSPAEALDAITDGARRAMGLVPSTVAPGSIADLVAIPGQTLGDAIARADQDRWVWKGARLVARTEVRRRFRPA